jgi:hypothetical protein
MTHIESVIDPYRVADDFRRESVSLVSIHRPIPAITTSLAANAAQSWGDQDAHGNAVALRKKLSECSAASQIEQWVINKGVHYNDWANLGKTDFQPVVAAFKVLTDLFQCDSCKSWLFVDNKHQPQGLRCA